MSERRKLSFVALVSALLVAPIQVHAEGFLAAVSPPRYELQADAGDKVAQVLTIQNLSGVPVRYSIRSGEWDFTDDGRSTFSDELKADSCRPWLRLERRTISVGARGERRFRFEMHVPEDAIQQECRLALFVEGADDEGVPTDVGGGVTVPVKGRVAVIVYLAVAGASADLTINGIRRVVVDGAEQFSVQVSNSGDATGRLSGLLRAEDANGRDYDVAVQSLPLLPGQTRELALTFSLPVPAGQSGLSQPVLPARLFGELFWQGGKVKVETELKP